MQIFYILLTAAVAGAALLATWVGWLAMFVSFIFPPLAPPVLVVMTYLPMVALVLICALPAVLAWRWPVFAVALLGLGGWIFAQTTFLVPSRSEAAVAAITEAVYATPPLNLDKVGHVALDVGSNVRSFECRDICQKVLVNAGADRVSVRSRFNSSTAVTFRKAYGDACPSSVADKTPCILVTRTPDTTPDITLRIARAPTIFDDTAVSLAGIEDDRSYVLTTADGQKFISNPGRMRQAVGWKLVPAWTKVGLDQVGEVRLVRDRQTIGNDEEHLGPFLRRAGFKMGDSARREDIPFEQMVTPEAARDALQGQVPVRIEGYLERKAR